MNKHFIHKLNSKGITVEERNQLDSDIETARHEMLGRGNDRKQREARRDDRRSYMLKLNYAILMVVRS